jgi:hypothetical protein
LDCTARGRLIMGGGRPSQAFVLRLRSASAHPGLPGGGARG